MGEEPENEGPPPHKIQVTIGQASNGFIVFVQGNPMWGTNYIAKTKRELLAIIDAQLPDDDGSKLN